MLGHSVTLLSNEIATGSPVDYPGGLSALVASGTFGGATVTVQVQSADGTWVTSGTALSAIGTAVGNIPPGRVRAFVSAGPPTALYVTLSRIPA